MVRACAAILPRTLAKISCSREMDLSWADRTLDLHLFQLRGDEALRIGQGLLADVVLRHQMQVRPGDLQIIAEDVVVGDLEGLDAGPLSLSAPSRREIQPLPSRKRALKLVYLRIKAVFDHAPVSQVGGRIFNYRSFQEGDDLFQGPSWP